jgi:hypothetical protein
LWKFLPKKESSVHVLKNHAFVVVVIASLIGLPSVFAETVSQRDLRLKKEAQNITQQSKTGYVYTSISMMGGPALRVDVDAALPLNPQAEKENAEWAAELFSMGFRRYVIVKGASDWVFTTGDTGFTGEIIGKSSDLPETDNELAKKNAVSAGALKAEWTNIRKEFTSVSNDSQKDVGPPSGATVYHGMYLGEPLQRIDLQGKGCFYDVDKVFDALLRQHRQHACLLISFDGKSLARFQEFIVGPATPIEHSLFEEFGPPISEPCNVTSESRGWACRRMKDGTWIATKRGSGRDIEHGGATVHFSQVLLMKR